MGIPTPPPPRTATLAVGRSRLHVRERGNGRPLLVVHGGPDFDSRYLLPEIDSLADGYRVVLYDQRGRGGSFGGERPDEITIGSEVEDLEAVRAWTGADRVGLMGHSFGAVLAIAYAIRHPDRVSKLVLLSPAPISRAGLLRLIAGVKAVRTPEEVARMARIRASAGWAAGEIEADRSWYRLHFRPAVFRAADLDRLLPRFRDGWTPLQLLTARAIEDVLYVETWEREDFDLLPALAGLAIPILAIHGDHDLIPAEIGRQIAEAVPGGRLAVIPECGHFAYLEQPAALRRLLDGVLEPSSRDRA